MSFEPKLIPAEPAPLGPDGDLQLDAALAELAAGLTADAQRLGALQASLPPAGEWGAAAPPAAEARRLPAGAWVWASLGLALVLALSWRWPDAAPPPSPPDAERAALPGGSGGPWSAPRLQPVDLPPWNQMSEPELEGYLDLSPRTSAKISI